MKRAFGKIKKKTFHTETITDTKGKDFSLFSGGRGHMKGSNCRGKSENPFDARMGLLFFCLVFSCDELNARRFTQVTAS